MCGETGKIVYKGSKNLHDLGRGEDDLEMINSATGLAFRNAEECDGNLKPSVVIEQTVSHC